MNSKASLERELETLIPAWNDPIPAALTSLAASLLAQSRIKASTLKPDEEIARSYACAHIACERLKRPLNLPKIQASPPCQPRVYKKLYQYLDQALPAKQPSVGGQPPTESTPPQPAAKILPAQRNTTNIATHSKKRALNDSAGQEQNEETEAVPQSVFSAIRYLCKVLNKPAAVPHTFAGISSLLQKPTTPLPTRRKRKTAERMLPGIEKEQVPAYIVAVLLCVVNRLSEPLANDKKARVNMQDAAINGLVDQKVIRDKERKQVHSLVNDLLGKAEHDWADLEWYRNIALDETHIDESFIDTLDHDDWSMTSNPGVGSSSRSLQIGLGTMMQDRIDWLSDERRANYIRWKAGVMAKIEQMEKRQASQAGTT